MAQGLIERYESRLHGVLSCYDRVVVTGTLPGACYAEGMTAFLSARSIRIFDYPRFAEPLRDAIRTRAAELAASAGIEIEHIRKDHIRKEDVVAKVLEKRGDHPGLVHVISAMEACQSYKPWHDKASHKTFLKPRHGQVLALLLLLHRPGGRSLLPASADVVSLSAAVLLQRPRLAGPQAQSAAHRAYPRRQRLRAASELGGGAEARRFLQARAAASGARSLRPPCCPVEKTFGQRYHWSFMQAEYSTDLVFRSREALAPLYEQLSRESVLSVKADQV